MADSTAAAHAEVPPGGGPMTPEHERASCESKAYRDAVRKSRENTQNARSSTLQGITKLLTKDQQAEYRVMLGQPFHFARVWGGESTPKP